MFCQNVADMRLGNGAADLVVAMYLLNYASTKEQLLRFLRACHHALRQG